ncbi:MAG: DUF4422 domain-containing protein [Lachnospiraceae bacterium]|jgi:hypothetical protein|nr:DUF4422 domain-containing protein [Lachnospiraceae bacterium]
MFDTDKKYFIYGAGDVGREVLYCLQRAPHNLKIEAFLVSNPYAGPDAGLEETIDNIPIISFEDLEYGQDVEIIVAVLEKYRDEICMKLDFAGIKNPILMTFESDLWCEERGKTYAHYRQEFEKRPYQLLQDGIFHSKPKKGGQKQLLVYAAKSHMDKPLKEKVSHHAWDQDIQVGAALTNIRIAHLTDCSGDHISEKNRQYCELTALYWIWKNAGAEYGYLGLCHYRRRFTLSREDVDCLTSSDVDVVVTNPVVNVPDVLTMYGKNHILKDWETMRDGIRKQCSQYLDSLAYVETSNYYIPYNMFIMKREVLNQYCEWLFPILEYCEAMCEPRKDAYQNRFIGFLAERLMTVYFYHHRERLKIIFSKKHFCE